MAQLPITEVVTVSVSAAQTGIGSYNTSNVALFTREAYAPSFGALGYKINLDPSEVGIDFGTSSETYKMATKVFSQQPNILAGRGYLAVIPFLETVVEVQHIAFSAVPDSGNWTLNYGLSATSSLAFNANAAAVQAALRLLTGLSTITVAGDYTAGFDITFTGVQGNATALTVSPNTLLDGVTAVTATVTTPTPGVYETLDAAIARTEGLIQYFGIMAAEITPEDVMLDAADIVQTLNKIAFFVSRTQADIEPGGMLDLLRTGNLSKSRGLYYGSDNDSDALGMMAAYVGRALSTDFSGSQTTQTMHLKDLIGVQPDPSMTVTILNLCKASGADSYVSIQGVPKVFCVGANQFFDQVYNLGWFVGGLIVEGFNVLAQNSTKIPQTEAGVSLLKGAYRRICELGVTNSYIAPGSWTSPTTFGILEDFLRNISERGYYIYSLPVATQLPADRAARIAPLIQIAAKEAGAIHSSNVIVYINP